MSKLFRQMLQKKLWILNEKVSTELNVFGSMGFFLLALTILFFGTQKQPKTPTLIGFKRKI
jgi:hypothetical protein